MLGPKFEANSFKLRSNQICRGWRWKEKNIFSEMKPKKCIFLWTNDQEYLLFLYSNTGKTTLHITIHAHPFDPHISNACVCVYVCECVSVWERERERVYEWESERESACFMDEYRKKLFFRQLCFYMHDTVKTTINNAKNKHFFKSF